MPESGQAGGGRFHVLHFRLISVAEGLQYQLPGAYVKPKDRYSEQMAKTGHYNEIGQPRPLGSPGPAKAGGR